MIVLFKIYLIVLILAIPFSFIGYSVNPDNTSVWDWLLEYLADITPATGIMIMIFIISLL